MKKATFEDLNPLRMLEHHKEHYIELKLFNKTYKPCARCLGQNLFLMPSALLFMLFYFMGYTFDFYFIFILSWFLALTTIFDWSSVELLHIREGNNKTRFITGGLFGISISMYIWLLPSSWLFKISTLMLYMVLFMAVNIVTKIKKQGLTIDEYIKNIKKQYHSSSIPKRTYCCGSCCTPDIGCSMCGSGMSEIGMVICGVACVAPCILLQLCGGGGCGCGRK